jgi:transposase
MSRKKRFILLDAKQERSLTIAYKTGKSAPYRERCHAILLSHNGKSISELCSIFDVLPNAITNWFNRWEKNGLQGLQTVAGQGRPCIIKVSDAPLVANIKAKVETTPKKLDTVLAQLQTDASITMSRRTLKRFLKKTVTDGSVLDAI